MTQRHKHGPAVAAVVIGRQAAAGWKGGGESGVGGGHATPAQRVGRGQLGAPPAPAATGATLPGAQTWQAPVPPAPACGLTRPSRFGGTRQTTRTWDSHCTGRRTPRRWLCSRTAGVSTVNAAPPRAAAGCHAARWPAALTRDSVVDRSDAGIQLVLLHTGASLIVKCVPGRLGHQAWLLLTSLV